MRDACRPWQIELIICSCGHCPYPVSVPENIILETNSSLIGYNEKLLKAADYAGLSNNDTWQVVHSLSEKWSISDSIWYDNPVCLGIAT